MGIVRKRPVASGCWLEKFAKVNGVSWWSQRNQARIAEKSIEHLIIEIRWLCPVNIED